MPTHNYIEKMLNLEDGCVKDFEIFKNSYIIYIELKRKAHYCPRCHNLTDKIKDYRTQKKWRRTSIANQSMPLLIDVDINALFVTKRL